MKASEARKLKVGDWVTACFSGRAHVKACEITHINWPTFTLKTTYSDGREMIRTRRYESLYGKCGPKGKSVKDDWPSWLERPASGSLSERKESNAI